ncbi:MAG: class I SAM-dependent methyltransferase [Myxococcales bacterium]|nr:class I SAM-dependent methyltransferase [Myxococcales bacterium]
MTEPRGPDRWFFDVWSRFYDLPIVQRLTYRPEHDAVLRALRRARATRVLDVGCGTGLLAARIRDELPGARVTGCDFSQGMLAQAAAGGRVGALVQASALDLPFRGERFDAVVSTEAFHWFPDQRRALAEFHRVLAPGGRLLVSFVNPPFEAMSRVGGTLSRWLGEPAHWPTRGRLRTMVEEAGFEVDSQRLVLRLPATFVLPSILTVATRPDPTEG